MGDSSYEELPLGEIADFRNGKGLSPEKYSPLGRYPVFGSNGQIARTDELLNEDPVVVIGRVGAYCGSVHPVFEPSWVTDNAIVARPKPGEDVRYLFYRLRSLDLRSTATGSAQPLVTQGGLIVLRAPHAPPHKQRAIARILGALDDKIELNSKMNATLEAMARALFKSWFVDFDPVRAKAEGRTPSGMDADSAKLFPGEFVESELGPIPRGWSVQSLDAVADFRNGLALQKFRPNEGEPRLPVVKIAQLRTGQPDSGEWAREDITSDCILDNGDVVFSWSGSLTVVVWCGGRAALNQHLFRVTSKTNPKWFFLQWLHEHLPEFQRIAGDKATTMGHIQRHHLTAAKCVVPDPLTLDAAGLVLGPLLDHRVALDLESRQLARLRDELLPRLLSGSLDVGPLVDRQGAADG